ncbi:unnamed protein product [Nippostrongylus brasiliensis]|uniref:LIM and SH3 domain protein 1 n=1 Tax=Nippostrongylus brasiliensis TaxID=27835 RepID=A0A0N4Y5D2_NIPBR|nr:unnamed protein product [Nippostrongylus brasiliensis]
MDSYKDNMIVVNGCDLLNRHELSSTQDRELQRYIDNNAHILQMKSRDQSGYGQYDSKPSSLRRMDYGDRSYDMADRGYGGPAVYEHADRTETLFPNLASGYNDTLPIVSPRNASLDPYSSLKSGTYANNNDLYGSSNDKCEFVRFFIFLQKMLLTIRQGIST